MNVNLTSVTESTKLSKGVSEMATSADEVSESEGFFAKLTAMLKGDSKAESQGVSTQEEAEVLAEAASNKSTDEMLEAKASSEISGANDHDESNSSASQLAQDSEGEVELSTGNIPQSLEKFIEKPLDENNLQADVDEAVAESEALLGRLEQANNTLQAKDGKALPRQTDVESIESQSSVAAASVIAASNAMEPNAEGDFSSAATGQALPAQSVLEPSSPQLTQDVQALDIPSEQASAADMSQAATTNVTAGFSERDEQQLLAKAEAETQTASVVESELLNRAAVESNGQLTEQTMVESQSIEPQAAGEASLLASDDQAVAEQGTLLSQTVPQTGNDSAADTETASAEVVTPAIAWASSATAATSSAPVDADLVVDEAAKLALAEQQTKVAHKLSSAELHSLATANAQQLNQANGAQTTSQTIAMANATPSALTPSTPMDLSAAQQIPLNVAAAVKPEQMALQASLGAKAAATLGKLAQTGEASNNGSESTFAQQLSQAAGQNALTQTARAEQTAQAQPTLQLSREMASEQVAERIQMMLSKNLKNIDIRLDPPELGRMQIRMNMNGDTASVHFTVANSQARDIVEQAMPRLREMLAQQGMQLSDSSVQQQASGQQQGRYASHEQGGSGQGNNNQHFDGQENLEADVKLDLNVASKRDGISYYA
ncbi:flagellar hook-length control protein FliK [Vibrio ponticus]|uniref:Flagellar hook-length control protein FliK n=1 Tax=Vibrio ponticus TaxID=265668 RepID=A0A3N3E4F1_9VIBR|nr:flagellar hook-length control protein FliK [Vibrio ponticus]ROV61606.1 flagellar hook-length control protein FliK [Vibrio ponticus]